MGLVYLPNFGSLFIENVGKLNIPYMDPLGRQWNILVDIAFSPSIKPKYEEILHWWAGMTPSQFW